MKTFASIFCAVMCAGSAALAASLPQPGDVYLISRDHNGRFLGSHKLFRDRSPDMKQVTYCAQAYFVRGSTIAWTQIEAERGNVIHVEFNFGRGWRPICASPEKQVTLADIGITLSPREFLDSLEDGEQPQSRLAFIGSLFRSSAQDTDGQ
ncbi:hypothetical protein [Roseibium sp. MMSF_3544]|uniref:hypothetical protein n=1 Tax=unclassified Roseibium TaxID=2629323 RepID=UPI00273E7100|nr:hypothetical protein [Roseibium sp. MMSF_3544]